MHNQSDHAYPNANYTAKRLASSLKLKTNDVDRKKRNLNVWILNIKKGKEPFPKYCLSSLIVEYTYKYNQQHVRWKIRKDGQGLQSSSRCSFA